MSLLSSPLNVCRGPAVDDSVSACEWRRRARRARNIAQSLIGDPAEQRLLQLAQDYEERAVEIAAAEKSPSP